MPTKRNLSEQTRGRCTMKLFHTSLENGRLAASARDVRRTIVWLAPGVKVLLVPALHLDPPHSAKFLPLGIARGGVRHGFNRFTPLESICNRRPCKAASAANPSIIAMAKFPANGNQFSCGAVALCVPEVSTRTQQRSDIGVAPADTVANKSEAELFIARPSKPQFTLCQQGCPCCSSRPFKF
jgi:hypothetical protein